MAGNGTLTYRQAKEARPQPGLPVINELRLRLEQGSEEIAVAVLVLAPVLEILCVVKEDIVNISRFHKKPHHCHRGDYNTPGYTVYYVHKKNGSIFYLQLDGNGGLGVYCISRLEQRVQLLIRVLLEVAVDGNVPPARI